MILITGASGNVGAEVLRQISESDHPVRAAFQSTSRMTTAPAGVETVLMDYNQPETVRAAVRDVDHVFLVGPVAPNLVELESRATGAMKGSRVRQIVNLSAIGTNQATFPRQHHQAEDYIRSSGIGYTFLRPNGFMQNMIGYNGATIRTQNAFYGCQADAQVSHIDVRDIAAVAVRVLTEEGHLGKTYTLTGPEALSNTRMAEMLSAKLGREIKYVDIPPEKMKQALLEAGVPEWSADGVLDLSAFYRLGGAGAISGDVEQILGRKPRSFDQFCRDFLSSFQPA